MPVQVCPLTDLTKTDSILPLTHSQVYSHSSIKPYSSQSSPPPRAALVTTGTYYRLQAAFRAFLYH